MEMVCESCDARGKPSQVWQSATGIGLECGACGHINKLASEPAPVLAETDAEDPAVPVSGGHRVDEGSEPAVLLPVQCQKCGYRQQEEGSCHRCGFVAANYRAGKMPWEKAPEGKEESWEEAETLWAQVEKRGDGEDYDRFMEHCLKAGLEDHAARRLSFVIADNPDDERAPQYLSAMIDRGRARLAAQFSIDRESAENSARRFRMRLTLFVLVVAVGLSALFFLKYPDLLPF